MPASTAASERKAVSHASDEQAMRDVVTRLVAAWMRCDVAATAAELTEDVDIVVPPGWVVAGRANVEAQVAKGCTTLYKDAHETATTDRIRFITPDVAIGDGTFTIVGPNFPGDVRGLQTAVLVKTGGRWKLAAMRRMVPTPPPPASAPSTGS